MREIKRTLLKKEWSFLFQTKEYRYTIFKHDKTGDTYYVRYGGLKGYNFGELELSEEDSFYEIKKIFDNLFHVQGIENIFDIHLLNKYITDALNNTVTKNSKWFIFRLFIKY